MKLAYTKWYQVIEDDKLTIRSLKLFSVIIIAQLSQKPREIIGTIIVPILHYMET